VASLAQRLSEPPQPDPDALPCPFCGAVATIEYWHGGKPSKRLISCSDALGACEVAPSVTGENRAEALKRWNTRA
jgi:hypothetical protein